jgi:hypothetical protein
MFQLFDANQSPKSKIGISLLATAASFERISASSIMAVVLEEHAVDDWELRCRFNRGRYFERMEMGDFRPVVIPETVHPAPSTAGQPPNTLSEMVSYLELTSDDEVCRVHQYRLETGRIGGSGRPDPKGLWIQGIHYKQRPGPRENRDPSLQFFWLRGAYVFWRRVRCFFVGR